MSFLEVIEKFENFDYCSYWNGVKETDVETSLKKDRLDVYDFLNLLSPVAGAYLEQMAHRANRLTVQYFGRTISLFVPLYISNYCRNECVYCGFSSKNKINRKKLSLDEIDAEAKELSRSGIQHILLLTGEARDVTPFEFLVDSIQIVKKYFASVSIEIFPMTMEEYSMLRWIGVDGLTVYQEVYDRDIYKRLHLSGRKKDYLFRLETPERGAEADFRVVNIGALFGLGDIGSEAFLSGMHAKYLDDKYPQTEICLSLPRLNDAQGSFRPRNRLNDKMFVQIMTAYRLFLPRVGITISTREKADFRDHLVSLGATRYSAGSKTCVGGYVSGVEEDSSQFAVSDDRNVEEVVHMLKSGGYQPVFNDWELF